MEAPLSETQCRLMRMIFERGAESASLALSKWLNEDIRLSISRVEQVDLADATLLLGPPETLVAACSMGLVGPLSGTILVIFEDRSGLSLVDLLMSQPIGTAASWGDLEQSAAQETTNIVGCAYINALAAHLPGKVTRSAAGEELIPTPPTFFHEFAGSLLEFALMDQAMELDRVLLVHTAFTASRQSLDLNWTLLFIPDRPSLQALVSALVELERP